MALGLVYFLLVWAVALTAINGFAPNYALGLFFVFALLGVVLSLRLENERSLIYFLAFGVLLTSGAPTRLSPTQA